MKYCSFLFLIFFTSVVRGQQLDFVKYHALYDYNYGKALCVTHDNYRLVTGQTQLHNDDIYFLMKLDSAGNFIWSTFGNSHDDGGYMDGRVVIELSNNNYAVGCRTCCGGYGIFVVIYDSAGNLLKRKSYYSTEELNISNMMELNGSLYIFGSYSDFITNRGFMCKTDLNADTNFLLRDLPFGSSDSKQSVLLMNDRFMLSDGIFDTVTTTSSPRLTVIDTTGAIINQWTYSQLTGRAQSICKTYDGGYVFNNMYPNFGLNKIDSAGNLLWSKQNILTIDNYLFSVDTNVLVMEDQYFYWYDSGGNMFRYTNYPLGPIGEACIYQNHILVCGGQSTDSVYYSQFSDSMVTNIDLVQSRMLNIYPNPASTHVTVLTNDFHDGEIIITNQISQEVMRIPVSSNQPIDIDIRRLSPGFYNLLLVESDGRMNYGRLVVGR